MSNITWSSHHADSDIHPGGDRSVNLLKSLEMFRAVAEHESFTRAADELSLAQPPISRGVADLERHLGVRLFDRGRRRIRLTAAGRAVPPDILEILRRIDGLAEVAGRREEGTLIGVHGRLDPAVLVSATKERASAGPCRGSSPPNRRPSTISSSPGRSTRDSTSAGSALPCRRGVDGSPVTSSSTSSPPRPDSQGPRER
ncbi:LysR family transcriptional regulator [Brevibacterium casei]|nr:LysR family transcriptional regulator [Brevibacterium casei]